MIISHRYRYLFVELPHTGTTAISKELRELYAGERILRKHAHYWEFARSATRDELTYFVFAGIRNPLDEAVSIYERIRSDHKGAYSSADAKHPLANEANVTRRPWVTQADIDTFRWIRATGADFPAFFSHQYRRVYDNWSTEAHHQFNFVVRFENLQADFAAVLDQLGIEQVRPLPSDNRTAAKRPAFASYYTPEIIPHARRIFGPFMDKWGYRFPEEWGDKPVPLIAKLQFRILGPCRRVYWRFVRPVMRAARS